MVPGVGQRQVVRADQPGGVRVDAACHHQERGGWGGGGGVVSYFTSSE